MIVSRLPGKPGRRKAHHQQKCQNKSPRKWQQHSSKYKYTLLVASVPNKSSKNLILPCNSLLSAAVASTARIIVLTVVISNLASGRTTTVLPSFLESRIKVGTDDTFVELGAANVFHRVQRIRVRVVLDKTEAAGSLVEAVQSHHQTLDLAAFAEELVYLLFGCVEGAVRVVVSESRRWKGVETEEVQIANIESRRVLERVFACGGSVAGTLAFGLCGQECVSRCNCSCEDKELMRQRKHSTNLSLLKIAGRRIQVLNGVNLPGNGGHSCVGMC